MLSKNFFEKGLKKLLFEFESKGFKMPKERADQWYESMKTMNDEEFTLRINYVLKSCTYPPGMADIFKADITNKAIEDYL